MSASTLKSIFTAVAALAGVALAAPAQANSSAAADISAPLRTTQAAKSGLGGGDEEFSKLFSGWQSLDTGTTRAPARTARVSIPSRMPVEGIRLTSDYGMRNHPVTGGRRAHKGVDLAGPTGTPIYATADGLVGKAEWFGGYGLYVQLEHGGNLQSRYGHMSRLNVAEGQRVTKGEVIGYLGSTGRSTGPHLHYEVRIAGEAVNPIPYMQASNFQLAVIPPADDIGQGGPE